MNVQKLYDQLRAIADAKGYSSIAGMIEEAGIPTSPFDGDVVISGERYSYAVLQTWADSVTQ